MGSSSNSCDDCGKCKKCKKSKKKDCGDCKLKIRKKKVITLIGLGNTGPTGQPGPASNTGATGPTGPAFDELFINLTNFVDPTFGNNATAVPQDLGHPYQTLAAALAAAPVGYTVYVHPGIYNETNLLKNGVNWYFSEGAIVNSGGGIIFDDSIVGPVISQISGYGNFNGNVLNIVNPGSQIQFQGETITASSPAILVDGGNLLVDAVRIKNVSDLPAVEISSGYLNLSAMMLESSAGVSSVIFVNSGDTGAAYYYGGHLETPGPNTVQYDILTGRHDSLLNSSLISTTTSIISNMLMELTTQPSIARFAPDAVNITYHPAGLVFTDPAII